MDNLYGLSILFHSSTGLFLCQNLPAMQETQLCSLDWEGPLDQGMETHSSILAWRISRTEEPAGLQSVRVAESDLATDSFTRGQPMTKETRIYNEDKQLL